MLAKRIVIGIVVLVAGFLGFDLFRHGGHLLPAKREAYLRRGYSDDSVLPNAQFWKKNINGLRAVAFSPDGSLLASGDNDGNVIVWRYPQKSIAWALHDRGQVFDLAFSPNGKLLAIGSRAGTTCWDVNTGRGVGSSMPAPFLHIAFSPDSASLAISGEGKPLAGDLATPAVYDVASGKRRFQLRGHTASVPGVAFSPDGRLIATAGYDHTVKLWLAADGKLTRDITQAHAFGLGLAFSPDSKTLAVATTGNGVGVWDVPTGTLITQTGYDGHDWSLVFSPDGRRLAAAGEAGVQIFDTRSWKGLYWVGERAGWPDNYTDGAATTAAYSPDGITLLFGNTSLIISRLPEQ